MTGSAANRIAVASAIAGTSASSIATLTTSSNARG